ncbi:TIGR02270 family protein [Myxococcus sp. AM001]|uniref:TIGR02270 family protein n=1 Tax=Myxococcus vastator TaxID=2709664 RepID=UPI0013D8AC05|nr:TIGR02270 family protein [Myxococcus vastator]NVJ08017.1 TIGR02270 family protein [Myxococcus sp. AM001]
MAKRDGRLLRWDIHETHLDEAAFRWSQWEQALDAPDFTLTDVSELEEQLAAHVDGLVLGGAPVARRLLEPALTSEEPERIVAATLALLGSDAPTGPAALLAALAEAEPPTLAPLQRAFELNCPPALGVGLSSLLKQGDTRPELQALVLDTLGAQGLVDAPLCQPFVTHPHPLVAAAALRAASRSRVSVEPTAIQRALESNAPLLRDAAIAAGLQAGHRNAWATCQAAAEPQGRGGRLPLLALALNGDERDLKVLLGLLSVEPRRPDVLWALGFAGRLAAADACLEQMHDKATAALAGEAFSAITGLRIEGPFVRPPEEEPEEPTPLESEDLDADLKLKPEDALPVPHAERVAAWWQENRPRFDARQRYLVGQPLTPQALLEALTTAPMRRRHALALELAFRSRGAIQVPTRRWVSTQLQAWTEARATPASSYSRPFAEGLRG